jgi:hypothetical protein
VGTLLGTIVPLLPLFLPAFFIFFIIVRHWGLVLLTALFTAFVSPAAVHSVRDGLKIAGDTATSAKGIWHGVLRIWPGLQDGLIYLGRTVQGWGEWILGYIWPILAAILRALAKLCPKKSVRTSQVWCSRVGSVGRSVDGARSTAQRQRT